MYQINNIVVKTDNHLVESHMDAILKAPKFINFVQSLNIEKLDIDHIRIDNVKWFCGVQSISPEKLGFLYLEVVAKDKRNGKPVAGVVFLRGSAVAIHLELECQGQIYVAITRQMRLPTGDDCEEIPAGMVDASDNVAGVAIKEVEEETGIKIGKASELINLGRYFPSQGGCDEWIQVYYKRVKISYQQMEEVLDKTHGVDDNESIRVKLIPLNDYDDYLDLMMDSKAEVAWRRVQNYHRKNPTTSSFCSIM